MRGLLLILFLALPGILILGHALRIYFAGFLPALLFVISLVVHKLLLRLTAMLRILSGFREVRIVPADQIICRTMRKLVSQ